MNIIDWNSEVEWQACFRDGTFVLENPPLDFSLVTNLQTDLCSFYRQDLSVKESYPNYFPLGVESGSKSTIEKKESYAFYGNRIDEAFDAQTLLIAFSSVARQLWHSMEKALFPERASSILLGEDSDQESILRSFRYYPLAEGDPPETGANSLHTDWNLLTLVWTDGPGFQFEGPDGKFEDVGLPHDQSLLVNFGDYLAAMTEGRVVSPWHKVDVARMSKPRNSLVFFYYPSPLSPAVHEPVFQGGRPLGLFVDQSSGDGRLWDIGQCRTMGEVYARKWQQVKSSCGS